MTELLSRRSLEEQAGESGDFSGELQEAFSGALKGDSGLGVSYAEILSEVPQVRLGSVGSFTKEDLGIIRARYVRFSVIDESKPLVMYEGSTGQEATNDTRVAVSANPTGLLIGGKYPRAGEYGWVVFEGLNPNPITLVGTAFKLGDYIGQSGDGYGRVTAGAIGRVADAGLITESGGVYTAQAGAIYFDVGRYTGESGLAAESKSIRELLADSVRSLGLRADSTGYQERADLTALINGLSLELGSDLRTVERAAFRLEQSVRTLNESTAGVEQQQTLAAIANFARLAESGATAATEQAQQVNILAVAVNQQAESARVFRDGASVFSESAREASNVALVSRNESNDFALASATSATEAEASATDSANSATASETSRLAADSAATGASTSAGAASISASAAATSESSAAGSAGDAQTAASSASTSESNAATSAATATTQAGVANAAATAASASETSASNSAAAASSSESLSATYRTQAQAAQTAAESAETDAQAAASAALSSSQSASASESAASTSETNAANSATTATTAAGTATTQAGIATTKATEASNSASSASTSETLSAGYSVDSLVRAGRNPAVVGGLFSNPDQFFLTTNVNQAEDSTGAEASAAPGATQVQDVDEGSVLELTIGSLGSRLLISRNRFPVVDDADKTYRLKFRYKIQSDGSSATRKFRYGIQVHRTDNGNYGGVAGFFQTVQASAADGWQEATWDVDGATLVAHGSGSPNSEIRPHVRFTDFTDNTTSTTVVRLSQLQIEDISVTLAAATASAVEAKVSDVRGVTADSTTGEVAAFIKLVAAASGSNPAFLELLAGASGSRFGLVADVIALGNSVDGVISEVLRIENGEARLNNALIRNLKVAPLPSSEIFHDVQLKPIVRLASDGDVVQYDGGNSYGAHPDSITPNLNGLPALAAGESYDVRATSITNSQFTAYAKKVSTGGSFTTQTSSAGTNVGGTPQWQTNKPVAADAYNDEYQFTWAGTLDKISETIEDFTGTPQYYASYLGEFALYMKDSGGTWQLLKTVNISQFRQSTSTNPATRTFTRSEVVTSDLDGGTGANHFGVHDAGAGAITSFNGVTYETQSGGTTTAVSGLIKWSVVPPVAT